MKDFKSSFIVQFIIDFLVFSIIYTIISRILTALCVNFVSISGYGRCYPIILLQNIFICLSMISALFVTQKTLSKKDVTFLDEPKQFYMIFCGVLVALGIFSSLLGIGYMTEVCKKNVDSFKIVSHMWSENSGLTNDQIVKKFNTGLKVNVIAATIISGVIHAAGIMGISVSLTKRHERLF